MKSNDEASSSKLVTDELSDVQPAVADDGVSTISSAGTAANCAAGYLQVVINELLSYVSFYRDRCTADNLRKVVVSFYTPLEISAAKKVLVSHYSDSLDDCSLKAERRKSSTRAVHEAELDDIIGILNFLDQRRVLGSIAFVAMNFDRTPKYGPEELNICTVVDRQVDLGNKMTDISTAVNAMKQNDVDVKKSIETAIQPLTDQVKKLTELYACMSKTVSYGGQSVPSSTRPAGTLNNVDRSRNIVIIGIEENKNSDIWRQSVTRALKLATGRDVHVDDALRLGKFDSSKKRPILVKLGSTWDRRLVLTGSHKLNNDDLFRGKVFIRPDEAPQVRRGRILDRLKRRAESNGHLVSVTADGVLCVNGSDVFSIQSGFIGHHNSMSVDAIDTGNNYNDNVLGVERHDD